MDSNFFDIKVGMKVPIYHSTHVEIKDRISQL